MPSDFLDVSQHEFNSLDEFFSHIYDYDLESIDGRLKIIGSISGFESTDEFITSLESHFDVFERRGQVLYASAQVPTQEERVPYYIFVDDTFPLFFTTGTLTKQIPPTLQQYLISRQEMSRMWVAKREMERLRQQIVANNSRVIVPFFTGSRTEDTNIRARRRPDIDRTIVYYGDDGLESFREMKHDYGVLPTNIEYECPGHFHFRMKQEGIFTLMDSGIREVAELLYSVMEHLQNVKDIIDTSEYGLERSRLMERNEIPYSEPWGIQLQSQVSEDDISKFRKNIGIDETEFDLTEFSPNYDSRAFDAEIVDTKNYARTDLRTNEETIRIYPREHTGLDQNVRLFNFVDDYIDPECVPVEVA